MSRVASIIVKWKTLGTTRTLPRVGLTAKRDLRKVRRVTKKPTVALTELQKSFKDLSIRHITARLEFV